MDMTGFQSKRKNDCVVVALSQYCRKPYKEIETMLDTHGRCKSGGYTKAVWNQIASALGLHQMKVPRRGQERMYGVIRTSCGPKTASGHLCVIMFGRVYDTQFPEGVSLGDWRRLAVRTTINEYWQ